MKATQKLLYIICCIGVWFIVTGCNSDIFVDAFLRENLSISLSETENNIQVQFEASNWNILSVEGVRSDVVVTASDMEGRRKDFPFGGGATGVVHYGNEFLDFRIEKPNGRELTLTFSENLYDQEVDLWIIVGNKLDEKLINVSLQPTQKYQIDSVSYQWDQFSMHTNLLELVSSVVIDNSNSSTSTTYLAYPYKYIPRRIRFDNLNNLDNITQINHYLGIPRSQILIPDVIDGTPGLYGREVEFGVKMQTLDTDLDKDYFEEVTIAAGEKRKIETFVCIEYYEVPYQVYLKQGATGKKRTLSGIVKSYRPFDYLIVRKKLSENE